MAAMRRIGGGWTAVLVLWCCLLVPALAADIAAADQKKTRLDKIFSGSAPESVADLKAMQLHVQGITDKLIAATVGVQVGGAWGSGVIITKEGTVLTAAH